MVFRQQECILSNCTTKVMVNDKFDIPGFAIASDYCKFHKKVEKIKDKIFEKLIPKYNKKEIKGKNGRIMKFEYSHDIGNYLYVNEKRKYNKLTIRAEKIIKKREAKNK